MLQIVFVFIFLMSFQSICMAEKTTTASGLKYEDQKVGTGAEAKSGNKVSVHYSGWIWEKDHKGAAFDSSMSRGQPLQFNLGTGQVIKGWDEGVAGMKVGGKRTLYIPSKLAYGTAGIAPLIPPNADLMFEVELMGVE